jgi:hypothetical protein
MNALSKDRELESDLSVGYEPLQIRLGNRSDGINVRARTVVLGQVSSQSTSSISDVPNDEARGCSRLIDVRTPQYQQSSIPPSDPRQQLSKQVRQQHPQPRLDVLQRQVLRIRAPVRSEFGLLGRDEEEESSNGEDDGVHVQIDVISAHSLCQWMNEEGKRGHARSDSFGEIFGSLASLDGRVLSSHVAGMEDPATELASVGRKVV